MSILVSADNIVITGTGGRFVAEGVQSFYESPGKVLASGLAKSTRRQFMATIACFPPNRATAIPVTHTFRGLPDYFSLYGIKILAGRVLS